jgi:hypothetical protein
LLLALLVPNVVALPAIGRLADRPTPWNWVALAVLAVYFVVVTVILQRQWSAGRQRRNGRPWQACGVAGPKAPLRCSGEGRCSGAWSATRR